jgi:transposase
MGPPQDASEQTSAIANKTSAIAASGCPQAPSAAARLAVCAAASGGARPAFSRDAAARIAPIASGSSTVDSRATVGTELDLTETALRSWVRQAEVDAGRGAPGALTSEEREELGRLRRETRTLRMERPGHQADRAPCDRQDRATSRSRRPAPPLHPSGCVVQLPRSSVPLNVRDRSASPARSPSIHRESGASVHGLAASPCLRARHVAGARGSRMAPSEADELLAKDRGAGATA